MHWFEGVADGRTVGEPGRSIATPPITELPAGRSLDRRRRRAEQHLGHLRRHGDRQGVPQGLAGHQPRHRGARRPRRRRQHAHRGAARLARGQLDRRDRRSGHREPGDGPGVPQGRDRGLGDRPHQRPRPLRRGRPARRRGRRRLRRRGAAARGRHGRGARGARRGAADRPPRGQGPRRPRRRHADPAGAHRRGGGRAHAVRGGTAHGASTTSPRWTRPSRCSASTATSTWAR